MRAPQGIAALRRRLAERGSQRTDARGTRFASCEAMAQTEPPQRALPRDAASIGDLETVIAPSSGAGLDGAASMVRTRDRDETPHVSQDGATPSGSKTGRYVFRQTLGAGGMGEVQLCHDTVVGREVALKIMRADPGENMDALQRFLREARVQGQIEHPSVVPVYDLGVLPSGQPFFTMKRVRGITLEDAIALMVAAEPGSVGRFTRRRLLSAFSQLCLAIDFAHARGVVHRDIKPSNVMLGDHGEVHVLDWGIAKVLGDDASREHAIETMDHSGPSHTVVGAIIGTPGYMSPEQVRGEVEQLGPTSDVYALGAVLFEILTGEKLYRGGSPMELLALNACPIDVLPSGRRPAEDVPPELDALCERALAATPNERLRSAREMSEAIERFLDGDRDEQRRKAISAASARAARALAVQALSQHGPAALTARARALREVSRALAFDPSNTLARGTLARLLMDAPADVPPQAEAAMDHASAEANARVLRLGALRYATWLAVTPLLLWMGVRSWPAALVAITLVSASSLAARTFAARRTNRAWAGFALLALSTAAVSWASVFVSPFIVVPALAATNGMLFALLSDRSLRKWALAASVLAVLAPVLLELSGLVPRSFTFVDGSLTLHARAVALTPAATLAFLLVTSAAMAVTPTLIASKIRDQLTRAETSLLLQAWQLRQTVPDDDDPAWRPSDVSQDSGIEQASSR
jgi:tRNA A-37 threonylcarbamoyl transferase component Bud32